MAETNATVSTADGPDTDGLEMSPLLKSVRIAKAEFTDTSIEIGGWNNSVAVDNVEETCCSSFCAQLNCCCDCQVLEISATTQKTMMMLAMMTVVFFVLGIILCASPGPVSDNQFAIVTGAILITISILIFVSISIFYFCCQRTY